MRPSSLVLAGLLLLPGCSDGTPTARPTPTATPTATGTGTPTPAATSPAPAWDPRDFTASVTNAWFPLPPGRTLVYRGTADGEPVRDVVVVSDETEVVAGVRCRVVLDRAYVDGALAETTRDYYAQHRNGDVWYFGEDTAELEPDGTMIGTAGTWRAGLAGAEPGIVMTALPRIGETHQQELLRGIAEDRYRVNALGLRVATPYRTFVGVLRTLEWSPLEPGVLSHKLYARGIGLVKEQSVRGGDEVLALSEVHDG